ANFVENAAIVLTLSTFAPRRRSYHAHQSVTLFDRCRKF
ncbi:MAG: hypothetical protein ACI9FJ_003229, partial [Alteromonadaceae bacterium]